MRSWRPVAVAVLLAAIVQWPALDGMLFDDDYPQLGFLAGFQHPFFRAHHRLDLYNFGDVAFFRPLTSALMNLDWMLFRTHVLAFHAHSLLWYLALVVVAALLFRRVTPSIALPATLLFALNRGAATTVVWWCNRHLLISAVFGCLAILAHIRAREEGWRPGRWLCPLALLATLLASESGMQAVVFLIAYEVVAGRGSRVRSLAPVVGVAVAYLVVRGALGYGVRNGMWGYFDPIRQPLQFGRVALERFPDLARLLLGGGWESLARIVSIALACAAGVFLVKPSWSGLPEREARAVQWLLLGAVLSLPIALASPQPLVRLLPSLAVAVLVATLLRLAFRALVDENAIALRVIAAAAVLILVATHGIASPLAARADAAKNSELQRLPHLAIVSAPLLPTDRNVVALSGSPYLYQGQLTFDLFRPQSHVESWTQVDVRDRAVRVQRTATNVLTIESTDGAPVSQLQWVDVVTPALKATALDGTATRVKLSFERPIGSFCFLAYRDGAFVRLAW